MVRRISSYRHLFFDLDDTVTPSRSPITAAMETALKTSKRDIIIVSGAQIEQIRTQLKRLPAYYLGQNGNHAHDGHTGRDIWRRALTPKEKAAIMAHIASIPRSWPVKDEGDLIEDRGCQISYSLIGHHELLENKKAFDPNFSRRRKLLSDYKFVSDTVEVKMGGTTTFDYYHKGAHKGHNVAELIKLKGWKKSHCVYFGDALVPGGNDESVIGVIDTVTVRSPNDTLKHLKGL